MGSNFKINESAVKKLYEQLGNQVRTIVNDTVQETADADVDTAIDLLHQRLNAVDGLNFNREWAQNAVETLRRGDDLKIVLK